MIELLIVAYVVIAIFMAIATKVIAIKADEDDSTVTVLAAFIGVTWLVSLPFILLLVLINSVGEKYKITKTNNL